MTKPTKKKRKGKPAPGKGAEWRQDPDGSWRRFEDPEELQRAIKEDMERAEREDPHGVWRKLDELAFAFSRAAEKDRSDDLERVSMVLLALDRPEFRKIASDEAWKHVRHEKDPRQRLRSEADRLRAWVQQSLDQNRDIQKLAEQFVEILSNYPTLYHAAPRAPTWGIGRWHEDFPIAVELVLARIAPVLRARSNPRNAKRRERTKANAPAPDYAQRVVRAGMRALNAHPSFVRGLFRAEGS